MFSLFIVDDEKWVRHGLRYTIDWQAVGIDVAGEAQDGEEAMERILARPPDILITDIKMPGIDGLQLMERLKKHGIATKVVIISGYNDFVYAKKAIQFGAYDYVLKPIDESSLLDVIRRCVNDLEAESRQAQQWEQMSRRMRESLPLARQRLVEKSLFSEAPQLPESVVSKWETLGLPLGNAGVKIFAAAVSDWGGKGDTSDSRALVRLALSHIGEEVGKRRGTAVGCPLDASEADFVLLWSASAAVGDEAKGPCGGEAPDIAAELVQEAKRFLGVELHVGVSQSRDAAFLPVSCKEAYQAMRQAAAAAGHLRKKEGNRPIIQLALDYVAKHDIRDISLNDVASHLDLNPSYFSKIFHEEYGETFSKFVMRRKIGKAAELLKSTTLKVYEISERIGYLDLRHFVRVFKEIQGMTPSQYRDKRT